MNFSSWFDSERSIGSCLRILLKVSPAGCMTTLRALIYSTEGADSSPAPSLWFSSTCVSYYLKRRMMPSRSEYDISPRKIAPCNSSFGFCELCSEPWPLVTVASTLDRGLTFSLVWLGLLREPPAAFSK